VLDRWFEDDVHRRLGGKARFIRYADDFVLLFERGEDARRVMEVLPKRFARFGLQLHPQKTRILSFDSPALGIARAQQSRSFDFLGFTHYWVMSRRGRYIVRQRTAKDRFSRSLKKLKMQSLAMRHEPTVDQYRTLCRMLRGHFNYYGITGNGDALRRYRHEAERYWGRALAKRSSRRFAWERFKSILTRFALPLPRPPRSVSPSEPTT
jgi:RNA-directed DNA polymerase